MNVKKTELIGKMDDTEKAIMAFKSLAHNDDAFDSIVSTVKRKAWIVPSPAFNIQLNGLYLASTIWGFEYQKLLGLAATSLVVASSTNDDPDKNTLAMNAYTLNDNKLVVLFGLLDDLAESHGLDFMSVLKMAEVRNIMIVRNSNECISCPANTEIKALPITIDHDLKKDEELGKYYDQTHSMLVAALNCNN